ncbi:MAG: amidohydrolase family protein [Planctomycetota bacterium]|nr:amidohydrolase family protein [Planctomycetota bacterium]
MKKQLIGGALGLSLALSFAAPSLALLADDHEEDSYLAIVGGDIFAGTGEVLRGATLLSKNGKIEEIGYELILPDGCETVDAHGMRVYPGLVALSATTRLTQGTFAAGVEIHDFVPHEEHSEICGDCGKSFEEIVPPALDPGEFSTEHLATDAFRTDFDDSFDPFSGYMVMALGNGITTVQQSSAAVKLKRGDISGVSLSEKTLTSQSWSGSNPAGKADLREKFRLATEYLADYRRWEEAVKSDKELKEPSKKGIDGRILDILEGRTMARFSANERADLLGIARLAQQFKFRPVIQGCVEGWTVAEELGRAGAFAIVTPRTRRDRSETTTHEGGSSIENAAILTRAGVQVAVVPANTSIDMGGISGRDLLSLPLEAGFAIRGGMDERAALESITVVPARLLGIDHRVGTLEIGKDCDALITDGDLLHYQTFVQYTVVEGKLVYDKQEEVFYSHIRPRPEAAVDPGEEVSGEVESVEVEEIVEEESDEE